jgi:hypothetical protein
MRHVQGYQPVSRTMPGVGAVLAVLAMGCQATISEPGAGGASTDPGGTGAETCSGTGAVAAKRIVRLSFNQVANSIGALIDPAFGTKLLTDFQLVDAEHRAFPPLQSPREGNSLTDQSWNSIDQIAQAAGQFVSDNFATVTGCGAAPTDACAQQYIAKLAQKAYRRPLTADEQSRLTTLYTGLKTGSGATINEAVQYSVYAIFASGQFLYRTEFGPDWKVDGRLTSYEVASMLSYFLTDSAPDQPLLDAAAQDKLKSAADIGAQVERLLQTDAAKVNLQGAMMSYFEYYKLENVVIQDPALTGAMRAAMYHEAELFLQTSLWSGSLNDLLLSRTGYVNATLAPIYGVAAPAGGADAFAPFDLPANRAGLLTQAGFLANRSRPDQPSVVGRGLLVKSAILCTETPPPPGNIGDAIAKINAANPDATQRELANIRGTTSPCLNCHSTFDAYGLALDTFDALGRFRDKDSGGRPIDPSVTLPDQVGGGTAKDIVEVGQKIAASGAFARCMGKNLANYALADVSAGAASIDSCAATQISQSFGKAKPTFPSLVKAVATSSVFADRSKGAVQ